MNKGLISSGISRINCASSYSYGSKAVHTLVGEMNFVGDWASEEDAYVSIQIIRGLVPKWRKENLYVYPFNGVYATLDCHETSRVITKCRETSRVATLRFFWWLLQEAFSGRRSGQKN